MSEEISLARFTIEINGEKYFGHPRMVEEIIALHAELCAACVKIDELRAEIMELRTTIIEANSAFNRPGVTSTWEETAGLVRMCHEGRAALDELARYHDAQYAAVAAAELGMIRP